MTDPCVDSKELLQFAAKLRFSSTADSEPSIEAESSKFSPYSAGQWGCLEERQNSTVTNETRNDFKNPFISLYPVAGARSSCWNRTHLCLRYTG